MNVDVYLDRIDYRGPRTPAPATLRALHVAHLRTVPFENLDIGLGRPIRLDSAALFDKVVVRRRGGFCYELNGLFAALLRTLGFEVTLLSARVFNDGQFGPEFDHLALRVGIPSGSEWLADVGFGDCFVEPLRFEPGEHPQPARTYRLTTAGNTWMLEEQRAGAPYERMYAFTTQPRRLEDFEPMCHWQQHSPESHFTQHRVCTRATPTGRVSIRDQRLIFHHAGERTERDLPDHAAFLSALREHFGIPHL